LPYRIRETSKEERGVQIRIHGPGLESAGFKLGFPSEREAEAFVVGLNFAFVQGFKGGLSARACPDCDRLWEEYARATRIHVGLIEQEMAVRGMDADKFADIAKRIEEASLVRLQVRQAVKDHETEKHALATHF